jgi:hypothetical protein
MNRYSRDFANSPSPVGRMRALPQPPSKITREELYRYVLRCALLNTEMIGRSGGTAVSGMTPPISPNPAHSIHASGAAAAVLLSSRKAERVNAFLSELLHPPAPIGDPKYLLSREFLRKFRKRFTRISEGKRAALAISDPNIVRQLTLFATGTMKQQSFKDTMAKNSTVAFLGAEFLRFCGEAAILNPLPYVRVLTDEAIDCLKYECVGLPYVAAMVKQFETYSQDMARKAQEQQDADREAGVPSSSHTPQEVYFHDSDGLVAWVRQVLEIDLEEHEKTARLSRAACTPKATIDDMKRCLAATEQDMHPVERPNDYTDTEAYLAWKKREIQQLNQLIAYNVTADPRLLTASSGDYLPGQARDQNDNGALGQNNTPQFTYVFIPPNPRECYKTLVLLCMNAELKLTGKPAPDQRLLSTRSLNLLKECGVRWRLGTTFRDLA